MLTIDQVADAVGGSMIGEPLDDRAFSGVVVDSRHVTPGALFVALRGQKHDGHDFVLDAFVKGARAALVERVPAVASPQTVTRSLPMIQVGDTLTALQGLASYWRQKLGLTVVGVTGSVGKTTTKEVVASVLGRKFPVLKNEGNLNTEIGLPLTLLRATPQHKAVVLEMGMYAPGDIRLLARLAKPDVGVVTNIGPTHLERMGSIERITEAKAELVEELPREGLAVLNFDDERVRAMASRTSAGIAYYGLDPRAQYWANAVESRGLLGIQFDLHHGQEKVHVRMPLLGLHSVHAALAAVAVGRYQEMSLEEVAAALHQASPALRLVVAAGINGSTIVDDSYNASPASTLAALNLLAELDGRKVAVLGDMLELGPFTEEGHRLVGRRAADVAQIVIAVGTLGALVREEVLACGRARDEVFLAETNATAIGQLRQVLQPGDCVLIKGSRGMHMEEIVEAIRCPTP